jgi:hypothetical protein
MVVKLRGRRKISQRELADAARGLHHQGAQMTDRHRSPSDPYTVHGYPPQRRSGPDNQVHLDEGYDDEAYEDEPRRRRVPGWLIALTVLLLLGVASVVGGHSYVTARGRAQRERDMAEIRQQSEVGNWAEARSALDAHAAALVRGDEAGWLAGVDPQQPGLRGYYQRLYATLRGLGVTAWSYHVTVPPPTAYGRSELNPNVTVAYCLQTPACPPYALGSHDVPQLSQRLTMARRDGVYVITARQTSDSRGPQQPTPFEETVLTIRQGQRVTVAAAPGQQDRLPDVVAAADRAAAVVDRYAAALDNPQQRYRIYLAGDRQWATWFGGQRSRYAVGYATASGTVATEVVLKMSALTDTDELATAIQHELAHVVTLAGTDLRVHSVHGLHQWLIEGIAEYIAHGPRPVTGNQWASLRRVGTAPSSLKLLPLPDNASAQQAGRFYGLSHFAVNCMAATYGEAELLTFVDQVLRGTTTTDRGSRTALGQPFDTVDRHCVNQLNRQLT